MRPGSIFDRVGARLRVSYLLHHYLPWLYDRAAGWRLEEFRSGVIEATLFNPQP